MKFPEYTEAELQVACGGPRRRWDQVWRLNGSGHWEKHDIIMVNRSKFQPHLLATKDVKSD
jgi:hypothetical protein